MGLNYIAPALLGAAAFGLRIWPGSPGEPRPVPALRWLKIHHPELLVAKNFLFARTLLVPKADNIFLI